MNAVQDQDAEYERVWAMSDEEFFAAVDRGEFPRVTKWLADDKHQHLGDYPEDRTDWMPETPIEWTGLEWPTEVDDRSLWQRFLDKLTDAAERSR